MKVLKAGTKKYLLLDEARIKRNAERAKRGEAIVQVVEVDGDVITLHRCHEVAVREATVTVEYSQHRPLKLTRHLQGHAAFVTEGEVVLDPDISDAPAPTAPAKPVRKSQKNPE